MSCCDSRAYSKPACAPNIAALAELIKTTDAATIIVITDIRLTFQANMLRVTIAPNITAAIPPIAKEAHTPHAHICIPKPPSISTMETPSAPPTISPNSIASVVNNTIAPTKYWKNFAIGVFLTDTVELPSAEASLSAAKVTGFPRIRNLSDAVFAGGIDTHIAR